MNALRAPLAGPLTAALLASLSVTGNPSVARAQSPLVPVWVRNEQPGISHRLVTREGQVVGSCVGDCVLNVVPGTYVFESSETEEHRRGKQKVVVHGPTVIDVSPGTKSTRNTGLATGIIGSAAVVVGVFGLMFTSLSALCGSTRETCDRNPNYTPWLLTMAGGAGLATAGWITFGTSGTKVRAEPYAGAVSFRASPAPGGGFFGATLAF